MSPDNKLVLTFCFGTSCFVRGARELYTGLKEYVRHRGLGDNVAFAVTFCTEQCEKGPVLTVGETVLERCTIPMAAEEIEKKLKLTQ